MWKWSSNEDVVPIRILSTNEDEVLMRTQGTSKDGGTNGDTE